MLNTREGNTAGIIFDLCNNGDGYTNKHNESEKGVNITILDNTKKVLND